MTVTFVSAMRDKNKIVRFYFVDTINEDLCSGENSDDFFNLHAS